MSGFSFATRRRGRTVCSRSFALQVFLCDFGLKRMHRRKFEIGGAGRARELAASTAASRFCAHTRRPRKSGNAVWYAVWLVALIVM